ncbi:MAG: efflux RND transporter periplasmic adaptor subunit, partial [Dysgonamonadaceae bacterium]|nr:efflux RND transporter periplasmic adaptor subunit [Dysgonamonadaceae bacterium]
MKKKKVIWSISAVCVVAIAAVCLTKCGGKGAIIFNTEPVQESTVETTVTATGYVQPVDKVEVGTQVSGIIEKIFVDFNSQVKKGQLLAEIDKSTLIERVTQAKATLTSSESDLKYAQQNFNRTKQLYDVKAATEVAYEEAVNRLAQAETTVTNNKANLHQAQVNLGYAEIYSPIDGVIIDRAVEMGQTVAASFNTPTLFTIANDLTKMQVEADVDEADIGKVREGQPVNFTVDAYPDDVFEGTVMQIRLQPTVTNNVVTYTVIVEAPNPDIKLYPGMTASITIVTQRENGLTVSAEALNFTPSPEMIAQFGNQSQQPSIDFSEKSVWLKTADGKITKQQVKTGMSDGVYVVVNEGLKAGDEVILSVTQGVKEIANA